MVGFSDPAISEGKGDGNQAEAAAVSQAATTAAGPLTIQGAAVALDAGDGVREMATLPPALSGSP
jgi:hypothetical protein